MFRYLLQEFEEYLVGTLVGNHGGQYSRKSKDGDPRKRSSLAACSYNIQLKDQYYIKR